LDNINKWTCTTYEGAARTLGVSVWRIRYAVESGYIPVPSVVLKRRALFSPEQIETMSEFFEVEDAVKKRTREEARALGGNQTADAHHPNQKGRL
jgi:hypothetical protein